MRIGLRMTAAPLIGTLLLSFAAAAGPPAEPAEASRVRPASAGDALARSLRGAVGAARPSVVTVRTGRRMAAVGDAPEAYRFGNGTGLVLDRAGGILTSRHVVAEADFVTVVLPDGRELPAEEVRDDVRSDLAVLKVRDAGELPEARFGDTGRLEVGDWVIVAGSPFGLGFSAAPGTVSARDREVPGVALPVLQTTAPSNPGNSGGPLLDLRGEVVGICAGGYSAQGGSDGVSFAVPSDVARFVARELIENGSVRWPYLGARFETLSPDVARELGCPPGRDGAVLTGVAPGGPASEAGLRVGDVVTSWAGRDVRSSADLAACVWKERPGAAVTVAVFRGPASAERVVRVGLAPPGPVPQGESRPDGVSAGGAAHAVPGLGLSVAPLPQGEKGVIVTGAEPGSPAPFLGVVRGAVVSHVGAEPVAGPEDFLRLVERDRADGAALLLVLSPGGGGHFAVWPNDMKPPKRAAGEAGTPVGPTD